MRFHFADAKRHRQVSRTLSTALRTSGHPMGLTAAADLAARLYGYADAHELDACVGRSPASRWDEDEAPGVVAARKARQVSALVKFGTTEEQAGTILAAIKPTARSRKVQGGQPARPDPAPKVADAIVAPVSVDALLDQWDKVETEPPKVRMERIVREAYDGGFDRIVISQDPVTRREGVVASHSEDWKTLEANAQGRVLLEWAMANLGAGPHLVRHGDVEIPLVLPRSPFPDEVYNTYDLELRLGCNLRAPGPTLGDLGLDGAWPDALGSRLGVHLLHVKCSWREPLPGAMVRLPDAIERYLSDRGIPYEHVTPASFEWRRARSGQRRSLVPMQPPELEGVVMVEADYDWKPKHLVSTVEQGTSVVIICRSQTPEDTVRSFLHDGMSSAFLRRYLVSSAALEGDPADATWRIDVRRELVPA